MQQVCADFKHFLRGSRSTKLGSIESFDGVMSGRDTRRRILCAILQFFYLVVVWGCNYSHGSCSSHRADVLRKQIHMKSLTIRQHSTLCLAPLNSLLNKFSTKKMYDKAIVFKLVIIEIKEMWNPFKQRKNMLGDLCCELGLIICSVCFCVCNIRFASSFVQFLISIFVGSLVAISPSWQFRSCRLPLLCCCINASFMLLNGPIVSMCTLPFYYETLLPSKYVNPLEFWA